MGGYTVRGHEMPVTATWISSVDGTCLDVNIARRARSYSAAKHVTSTLRSLRTAWIRVPPAAPSLVLACKNFSLVQLYWEAGSYDDPVHHPTRQDGPSAHLRRWTLCQFQLCLLQPCVFRYFADGVAGSRVGCRGSIYPTETTYVVAGIHDANGKRTTAGFNTFFDDSEYFTAVEIGWFPFVDQPFEGLYHLTLWNIDPEGVTSLEPVQNSECSASDFA